MSCHRVATLSHVLPAHVFVNGKLSPLSYSFAYWMSVTEVFMIVFFFYSLPNSWWQCGLSRETSTMQGQELKLLGRFMKNSPWLMAFEWWQAPTGTFPTGASLINPHSSTKVWHCFSEREPLWLRTPMCAHLHVRGWSKPPVGGRWDGVTSPVAHKLKCES